MHIILPYADIVAWCLMPNHFHLLVYYGDKLVESSEMLQGYLSLNQSIGIMLASYTRAINKQQKRSGSLFRKRCKAACVTSQYGVTPTYFNTMFGAFMNVQNPEKEYPQVCFNYIHNNPVNAKLVDSPGKWEFSSFSDYFGGREGKLVNKNIAEEFELI